MKNGPDKCLSPKTAYSLDSEYSQTWLSVLYLWYLTAVHLYTHEARNTVEEGWT